MATIDDIKVQLTEASRHVNDAVAAMYQLSTIVDDYREPVAPPPARTRTGSSYAGRRITADPVGVFLDRVDRGDPVAVGISTMLAEVGAEVRNQGRRGCVRSLGTLERLYVQDPELTARTLRVVAKTWHLDVDSLRGSVIYGVARFLAAFPDTDDAELADKLRTINPVALVGTREDQKTRTIVDAIADIYTR